MDRDKLNDEFDSSLRRQLLITYIRCILNNFLRVKNYSIIFDLFKIDR